MSSRRSSPGSRRPNCEPRFATERTARKTYGGAVAQIAEKLGTPLMPWQQLVADIAGEVDDDTGQLVHREVVLTVPRQSGKTTLILAEAVLRALAFGGRQNIVYTAQTRNDARKKWEDDHVEVLGKSIFRPMFTVRRAAGSEAIKWKNGSKHGLIATTEKSGHGSTLDMGVIDEAFAQVDPRLEQAMKPAMVTRSQPQLWIVSTAGTTASTFLRAKVDAGRERVRRGDRTPGVAYLEWSMPEDADPDDPASWWGCMPALGHTVTEATIRAERLSMDDDGFRRAYGNQWRDGLAVEQVIPAASWSAGADEGSQIVGSMSFAVDVTPDRSRGAIAVCGLTTAGDEHGEIVAHRPGTSWIVAWLTERRERWGIRRVALDPAGPAGSLVTELEQAGFELVLLTTRQMAQACAGLYDAVEQGRFRHLNQPELNAALGGAVKRIVGDSWLWSRRTSMVDICPLVAVTVARWERMQQVDYDVLDSIA